MTMALVRPYTARQDAAAMCDNEVIYGNANSVTDVAGRRATVTT